MHRHLGGHAAPGPLGSWVDQAPSFSSDSPNFDDGAAPSGRQRSAESDCFPGVASVPPWPSMNASRQNPAPSFAHQSTLEALPIEQLLQSLNLGNCDSLTERLQDEGIATASDFASVDIPDLRQLLQEVQLSILDRGRVLRWAQYTASLNLPPPEVPLEMSRSNSRPRTSPQTPTVLPRRTTSFGLQDSLPAFPLLRSGGTPPGSGVPTKCAGTPSAVHITSTLHGLLDPEPDQSFYRCVSMGDFQRLDEVEENVDFWCRIVSEAELNYTRKDVVHRRSPEGDAESDDFRENVIEDLFDLNPERLKEVYDSVDKDADGRILKDELKEALQKCGLHGLDNALEKVLQAVSSDDGISLELVEFESVLTRLKLAQLLSCTSTTMDMRNSARNVTVTDYNPQKVKQFTLEDNLQTFFFGHRESCYPMRWVHIGSFDLTLFLAMTVKYQLHPLSVEDVIHQSLTKVDRYGSHYFVAIEQLCLVGNQNSRNGQAPVQVTGRHVTIFSAGPPYMDTVVTIAQPDKSFSKDWPGRTPEPSVNGDAWVEKLHKRLKAVRSRARERRADYLMYTIIDLCADELLLVTKAFTARLYEREERLRSRRLQTDTEKHEWFEEVGTMKLQLAVVLRRLRGLLRLLRRLGGDEDMAVVHQYLADISDHANDAYEDAGHGHEKCQALLDAYEHFEEKEHDRQQQEVARQQQECAKMQGLQDERMNRMLFILTVSTTLFTPLTFATGVYGMNFVDKDGHPTIPELLNPHGYFYFWCFVIIYLMFASLAVIWLWRRLKGMRRQVDDTLSRRTNHRGRPEPDAYHMLQSGP
eukprot:TRINITY_DN90467_c0_g1_i1.p1 TRINITY_DN90467_c0_g1~~TRINITY_DN90467_c0_g1_i1.p1  ORF type:complete len:811 (-),score=108.06 TRINITY_DN90467_c0_g1_i1:426-2858(-)